MSDEQARAALAAFCPVCEAEPYRPCQENGKGRTLHPERKLAGRPRVHRPICAGCGAEWPCDGLRVEHHANAQANRQTERQMRLARLAFGDCLACGGKVTGRTPAYEFAGENLWRSDVPAVFHLKMDCASERDAYDLEWVKAWPRRERNGPGRTLKFRCGGTLTTHLDGSRVCTAAENGCGLTEMTQLRGRAMPVRHRMQVWCHPGHACETCEPKEQPSGLRVVR